MNHTISADASGIRITSSDGSTQHLSAAVADAIAFEWSAHVARVRNKTANSAQRDVEDRLRGVA